MSNSGGPGSSIGSTGGFFRSVGIGRPKIPSCNEILPRLYLGDLSVALNKDEITRLGITDMITIEIKPLQASDLAPCVKRYLFLNAMDHSKQDVLSHFETSNEFIDNALKEPTNKVYVHCVAGISRSASLVIAYVMKTRSMNYTEAHDLVAQKRRVIDPNEGFVRQLVLYHKMKYTIDISNIEYRRMVLDALVFEFRLISLSYYQIQTTKTSGTSSSSTTTTTSSIIQLPMQMHKNLTSRNNVGILFDQYYNKLHLQEVNKYPQVYDPNTAYRCNKCRAIVFYAISVIENTSLSDNTVHSEACKSTTDHHSHHHQQKTQKECPFIFIEPQPWMSRSALDRDGPLECYKCKRKLGKFDWTSTESCSCPLHNSHMNFNLFKIMRKKVDMGRG
jgi:dual specificity phosphatase 12